MIYENEFDDVWKSIVEGMITEAATLFGIKHKSLFWVERKLRRRYNAYKDTIVKTFMVMDTVNIDRHKIAACLIKAILVTKPLYIPLLAKIKFIFSDKYFNEILPHEINSNEDESLNKYFILFNEYLAIDVAVAVLNSYINSDDRPGRFKHSIVMPEPFPEPDTDYLRDVCIGLHYSRAKEINPVAYANSLFLWEKYSCRKAQCDNLQMSYESFLSAEAGMTHEQIKATIKKAKFASEQ